MTPELNRKLKDTKTAIEEAITTDINNKVLPAETANRLFEEQDIDFVKWILAETIKSADWDGRYYQSTKDWAKQLYIPGLYTVDSTYYRTNTHPCHINSLVQAIIKH